MLASPTQYVMVIEDQGPIRSVLRRFLEHHGYKVVSAQDGTEALWYLNNPTPLAAIVTDYAMPGLSGLEILQQIRIGHTRVPHRVPVILLSAYTEIAIVQAAQALDADAIVAKPFSLNYFHKRLARAVQARTAHASAAHYAKVALPVAAEQETHSGRASPGVVLTSSAAATGKGSDTVTWRTVRLDALEPGMVLAQPIHSRTGKLLAAPGLELHAKHIARIREMAAHLAHDDLIRVQR